MTTEGGAPGGADEQQRGASPDGKSGGASGDAAPLATLVHELRVHQVELEAQNEELRRARDEIDALRARYFDLYDLAPVGYFTVSPHWHIVQANIAAATLLDMSRKELVERRFARLVHTSDAAIFRRASTEFLATRRPHTCELRLLRSGGSQFWAHLCIASAPLAPAEELFLVTVTDVSAAHAAGEEAAAASSSKTHFIANMSHELRTPLSAVLGLSEALLSSTYGPLNAAQRASLTTIHSSGQHLLGIVNDVLDVARIEAGQLSVTPHDVPLEALVRECVAWVIDAASAKGQTIRIEVAADITVARVDPKRMKQVFINLLTNATTYSGPGATIAVGARTLPDCATLECWVADNGPGIPESERRRVFDPFVRLDTSYARGEGGAGLGLALVKRIVELHRGRVTIVDQHDCRGVKFVITLPLAWGTIAPRDDR